MSAPFQQHARPVEAFLAAAFPNPPDAARPWVAGFRCDPYHPDARWGGVPVNGALPDIIEPGANCYVAVSTFAPGDDGRIHRRKANFAAMHVLMIDDAGTKVPLGSIALEPSYTLETSPGNFQLGYLLDPPVTDRALAESVVEAMIAQGLASDGKDPGMKGVTRYGRLPLGINNKPALVAERGEPWRVRLVEWEPERRYSIETIIGAYKLQLGKPRPVAAATGSYAPPPGDDLLLAWLVAQGRVQGPANGEGWTPISCPWVTEHTGGADTGAAYLPANGFKCHHGHCEHRTIHDLRAWAKSHGWAREETAGIDPELAARCGVGPEPAAESLGAGTGNDWPAPAPLPAGLPPVEPFDAALLPDSLRAWIEDIASRLQCPPDFPAVGAMVNLAAVVGRKVGIRPKRHDDWLVIANTWGLIVGRPGVLKSPALHEVMKPIQRLEVEAKNAHVAAKADSDADKAVADARRKVNEGLIREAIKKGNGDPYEIARLSAAADDSPVVRRRYLVNDSSVEKLGELLNENPNGLLVFRDELLGLLYSLERQGQESSRQFYLEAWNGTGRFTYDRIGRGTVDIEACCLSILGSIQPGPLQDYLTTAPDDGLMQRFQLAVWPDSPTDWRNVDCWPDKESRDAAWGVYRRLDTITPLAMGATPPDEGGIPWLRFAPDAQEEFTGWRGRLERRLLAEDLPPALETCLAKHRGLIPSLALLIHLADAPEGGPVSLAALLKAAAWGEYLESHAWRIYSAKTNAAMLGAVRLAEKIKAGALGERFTLRDVYGKNWGRLDSADKALSAVAALADHDWLRPEPEQTGGRPRTWYVVNPALRGA